MNPTLEEKEKYARMWQYPAYRQVSPGNNLAMIFLYHFRAAMQEGETIADFGCGTGRASHIFLERGLNVNLIDIAPNCLDGEIQALTLLVPHRITFTEACLWELPENLEPTDWLYCCDVMEHLPEEYVPKTLENLARMNRKAGCFQIFLEDDTAFGGIIQDKLHLTIKPKEWWVEQLSKYWDIQAFGPELPGLRFSCFVTKKVEF